MVGPSLDAFHVLLAEQIARKKPANLKHRAAQDGIKANAGKRENDTMASICFHAGGWIAPMQPSKETLKHVAALTLGPPRTAVRHAFVNAMMFCIKSFIAGFGMFKQAF